MANNWLRFGNLDLIFKVREVVGTYVFFENTVLVGFFSSSSATVVISMFSVTLATF